jgi:hypothetical protein
VATVARPCINGSSRLASMGVMATPSEQQSVNS